MEAHRAAISNHMEVAGTIRGTGEAAAATAAAAETEAAVTMAVEETEVGLVAGRLGSLEAVPLIGRMPLLRWTGTADGLQVAAWSTYIYVSIDS